MTDLKAANEQLAHALKALESPEHDADVREAEACRNRLMELDERIGARIKAKLEAHRAISDAWINEEPDSQYYRKPGKPYPPVYAQPERAFTIDELKSINPSCEPLTAEAWEKHHEEHTGKYALSGEEVPDPVLVNGVAEMQQADDAN